MPRPRKNTTTKTLQGTFRRDRVHQPERQEPDVPTIKAPRGLSPPARRIWRSIAPLAARIGTLTPADVPLMALLCETLSIAEQAQHTIATEGMTIKTESGGAKRHPATGVLHDARSTAARLLSQFGLSPAGRQALDGVRSLPPLAGGTAATKRGAAPLTFDEYQKMGNKAPKLSLDEYLALKPSVQ